VATAVGYTQANRALSISTPLGEDKLLLRALAGQETVSQLFRFNLDLLSEDDSIKFDSIVGKTVTIRLEIPDKERYWNGYVSRFSQGTRDQRFTNYRAEVVPWLWFLTRTADCRIFQEKTAPQIIEQIFTGLGFQDFKLNLFRSYRQRDYCVQYRETDFNFVSRLMEEEGICYYFQHESGKHTMILADDAGAHEPCPDQPNARCELAGGGWTPDDVITEWRSEQEFRPSAWAHTDYNFETPSTSLMVNVQQAPKWEIYDYPGIYPKRSDGDTLAKMRLEETTTFKQRSSGKSSCRAFSTGFTVDVADHYRSDVNQKWLLTAVYHQATMGGSFASGNADDGDHYVNTFECIPASINFRPPRLTPKPHVQGCQTAVVTGPEGEEIYTDKYGRVKVHFQWDRVGKSDENSSCWIRVSHPWAGQGWGAVSIPRIGQEVVVDFLEGDPDQPLVVGRVYHAENMPPYTLPGSADMMGFRSNSTKGGGGYNEIVIRDGKSNELIRIHAQKDMDTTVLHDMTTSVLNNDTQYVKVNRAIQVDGSHEEQVKNHIAITSVDDQIYIQAATQITLTVGASSLIMDKEGNITLKGKYVAVVGSQMIDLNPASSS
jgi:type VI secretion system secreted protein VgrG